VNPGFDPILTTPEMHVKHISSRLATENRRRHPRPTDSDVGEKSRLIFICDIKKYIRHPERGVCTRPFSQQEDKENENQGGTS
jgi:hypothetical protein